MRRRTPWGVFLDRDGTLVPDAGHATRPDQLTFYPRTAPGLRLLRTAGARLIVVSNQSVVARGRLDAAGLARMDRRLRGLARQEGVRLHGTYYCPHHPRYSGSCACRKPKPGLIRRGLRSFSLSPGDCYLIGDTVADLRAGRAAGLRTVLVLTGYGRRSRPTAVGRQLADHVAVNVEGAARWILKDRG